MSSYGFRVKLETSDLKQAEQAVTDALAQEGFGILTEIDVSATLKKKLDIDFKPYRILGACNPKLAHAALEIDLQIGLLLPCNVVLTKQDNQIEVLLLDPTQMSRISDKKELLPLMQQARKKIARVVEALKMA